MDAYLDDVQSLVDGTLGIEGESCVDLSGDLARDDVQDLLSEFDQETIECGINLLVDSLAVFLAVRNSNVDQLGIFGLLGCGKDEGRVRGGILGLVFADCCGRLVFCSRVEGCIALRVGKMD